MKIIHIYLFSIFASYLVDSRGRPLYGSKYEREWTPDNQSLFFSEEEKAHQNAPEEESRSESPTQQVVDHCPEDDNTQPPLPYDGKKLTPCSASMTPFLPRGRSLTSPPVLVLNGIIKEGDWWTIWVNGKAIDNENSPHQHIGPWTIQNVTYHSVEFLHEETGERFTLSLQSGPSSKYVGRTEPQG